MFEAGQRVKVLVDKAFSGETGMRGREGAVLDNASSSDVVTYVKLDGANTDERVVFGKRMACEVFSNNQLKVVEAKSQKISIEEVQVGDEIVSFRNSSGVETRRKGVVGKIVEGVARTNEGNILTHFYNSGGGIYPAHHVYLLNRPEPKKPEIDDGVYWVRRNEAKSSNTIYRVEVATGRAGFFLPNGERTSGDYGLLVRTKNGLVSHLDFHTEDPTPKGFDALDKTKTYFLKDIRKDGYPVDWYLAFKEGTWKYGTKDDISTTAGVFEKYFTEGTDAWEKPVEWVEPELTDLEKFERAGYVGKKFDGGPIYKVTRKGNVKYKAPSGVWENSFHSADTFF